MELLLLEMEVLKKERLLMAKELIKNQMSWREA